MAAPDRPRAGLSADEAALWRRLAATVTPLGGRVRRRAAPAASPALPAAATPAPTIAAIASPAGRPPARPSLSPQPRALDAHGLDAGWDRRLAKGEVAPDFTLDLHGHGLEAAHRRLDHGLAQAATLGARVVLVIAGKPRPAEAADRGARRGAIRAKVLDWLALGPHAGRIAAVRGAHRRHGGAGALYVVLRRPR